MCVSVCICVSAGTLRVQKRASESPELESQVDVTVVPAGNQILVLLKVSHSL